MPTLVRPEPSWEMTGSLDSCEGEQHIVRVHLVAVAQRSVEGDDPAALVHPSLKRFQFHRGERPPRTVFRVLRKPREDKDVVARQETRGQRGLGRIVAKPGRRLDPYFSVGWPEYGADDPSVFACQAGAV